MLFHFSEIHSYILIAAAITLIASITLFQVQKRRPALLLLFTGIWLLGFFIAGLDGFIRAWDEQFHALVAKNLIQNPLKPTLYSHPVLGYDYSNWYANYIWLHKQPLFLWQIALSIKLFGTKALAVRLPSVFMHATATLMVYRIGKLISKAEVGFYGALCFGVSNYILETICGLNPTDHNDVAFLFYITASFWAYFEYLNHPKTYWILLIGLFSGCAILVKWLVGLLVYSAWGTSAMTTHFKNGFSFGLYRPLLTALLITGITFIPWQIFILQAYPLEAAYEFSLNTRHFNEVIEGHSGDAWFHFEAIKTIYGSGDLVPFLLVTGLFFLLKNTDIIKRVSVLSSIIVTYGFYTMAATKMMSFTLIIAPFGFLCFGAVFYQPVQLATKYVQVKLFQVLFPVIALCFIAFSILNLSDIDRKHTFANAKDGQFRSLELKQMKAIQLISNYCKDKDSCVVFNADVRETGYIETMFYTNCIAYGFMPAEAQIEKLKEKHYSILILDQGSALPDHVINDSLIQKIRID